MYFVVVVVYLYKYLQDEVYVSFPLIESTVYESLLPVNLHSGSLMKIVWQRSFGHRYSNSEPVLLLHELHSDLVMLRCESASSFKTLSVYKIYILYINWDVSLCKLSVFSLQIKLFPDLT